MIRKVSITEEHIRLGKQGSFASCPVALAIKEHTGKISILVNSSSARFKIGKGGDAEWLERMAPEVMSKFVVRFDAGQPVTPINFDLDIPDTLLKEPTNAVPYTSDSGPRWPRYLWRSPSVPYRVGSA